MLTCCFSASSTLTRVSSARRTALTSNTPAHGAAMSRILCRRRASDPSHVQGRVTAQQQQKNKMQSCSHLAVGHQHQTDRCYQSMAAEGTGSSCHSPSMSSSQAPSSCSRRCCRTHSTITAPLRLSATLVSMQDHIFTNTHFCCIDSAEPPMHCDILLNMHVSVGQLAAALYTSRVHERVPNMLLREPPMQPSPVGMCPPGA
jgi:hypothetical protein